jgi:hypothetical protein
MLHNGWGKRHYFYKFYKGLLTKFGKNRKINKIEID